MIATGRDGTVLAGVEGAVGGDAGDFLFERELVEPFGQRGRISSRLVRQFGEGVCRGQATAVSCLSPSARPDATPAAFKA